MKCKHCGYDTSMTNPSGYCNHVYYPEGCSICDWMDVGIWKMIRVKR